MHYNITMCPLGYDLLTQKRNAHRWNVHSITMKTFSFDLLIKVGMHTDRIHLHYIVSPGFDLLREAFQKIKLQILRHCLN